MAQTPYGTWLLAEAATVAAPDGSVVRPLAELPGAAGLARFDLAAGAVSRAVSHATVQEIWHIVAGVGELWRRQGEREGITPLAPGVTVTIPLGTAFQFRAGEVALSIVATTAPPWPGTPTEARPETGPWVPRG